MSQQYLVSSVGLSALDEAALQRLIETSKARDRIYSYLGENAFAADVIVVNADEYDAVELARDGIFVASGGVRGTGRLQAIVYAARDPDTQAQYDACELPLGGENFLELLDARTGGNAARIAREIASTRPRARRASREQALAALFDDLPDSSDLLEIGLSLEDLVDSRIVSRSDS